MNSAKENTPKNNGEKDIKLLGLWYGISFIVIVLDLFTKKLVSDSFSLYERVNVFPMFDITLRHNYGAAFSFLAGEDGWQVWFFGILASVVSIALVIWIARIGRTKNLEALGLALILGGALGNLYDRVTLGYVVDFILVYYNEAKQFPAFNIADSAITVGAGVILLDAFLKHKQEKQSASEKTESVS